MDSKALKVFLCVADSGGVARAGQQLHTVQSNVTAHVKRLEASLGVPLLQRQGRGVRLTPAGEILTGYARRVLHLLDEARKAVQDPDPTRGSLRLGTLETTIAVRLPPVLARFRREYPGIELQLNTGSTENLAERVLDYRLDGAFVAGRVDHPQIEQCLVFHEELVLVSEVRRPPADCLREEMLLVFRPGCAYRARAELWLREQGLLGVRKMEFGALDAMLGCVTAGMGVTLLPRVVVERPQYRELLGVHEIPAAYRSLPTYFIRRHDTVQTRAASAFVAMAMEAA